MQVLKPVLINKVLQHNPLPSVGAPVMSIVSLYVHSKEENVNKSVLGMKSVTGLLMGKEINYTVLVLSICGSINSWNYF